MECKCSIKDLIYICRNAIYDGESDLGNRAKEI